MTDPRVAAVEAAEDEMFDAMERAVLGAHNGQSSDETMRLEMQAARMHYLSSMAEAGWAMVRDVPWSEWTPATDGDAPVHSPQFTDGWNACRAAMLRQKGEG